MVRVPLICPDCAVVGANATLRVHEALTARVAVQVPPAACANPVENVKVPTDRTAVPVFVTVRVCAVLAVPSTWLPKVSEVGVTVAR
jgi:hypothetical protein